MKRHPCAPPCCTVLRIPAPDVAFARNGRGAFGVDVRAAGRALRGRRTDRTQRSAQTVLHLQDAGGDFEGGRNGDFEMVI